MLHKHSQTLLSTCELLISSNKTITRYENVAYLVTDFDALLVVCVCTDTWYSLEYQKGHGRIRAEAPEHLSTQTPL